MKKLFSVNAEGGPLLLLDWQNAKHWRGSENGVDDYAKLCERLDALESFSASVMHLNGTTYVVWEMCGAGSADVFVSSDNVVTVMRAWVNNDTESAARVLAAAAPVYQNEVGALVIESGVLAVLWAAESGATVPCCLQNNFERGRNSAIDGSVYAMRIPGGKYHCYDEFVSSGGDEGRRLRLVPVSGPRL